MEAPDGTDVDLAAIALSFNDNINARDLRGLARLMTADHTFIDPAGNSVSGLQRCLDAWRGFFRSFTDYRNVFTSVTTNGDVVTMVGYSECSVPSLAGPALWTAAIADGAVSEWRVYLDTPETRRQLAVQDDR